LVAVDINGDGWTDLLFGQVVDATTVGAAGFIRQAGGGFAPGPRMSYSVSQPILFVADVNHDGLTDILIVGVTPQSLSGINFVSAGLGQRGGEFDYSNMYLGTPLDTLLAPGVAAADLDGDGWIDIVYVGDNTGIEVMRQRRF
jgi:hypothetical protein